MVQRFLPFSYRLVLAMAVAAIASGLLLVGLSDAVTLHLSNGGKLAIASPVIWTIVVTFYRLQKRKERLSLRDPLAPPHDTAEDLELTKEEAQSHPNPDGADETVDMDEADMHRCAEEEDVS
jgi:hypothetical protein